MNFVRQLIMILTHIFSFSLYLHPISFYNSILFSRHAFFLFFPLCSSLILVVSRPFYLLIFSLSFFPSFLLSLFPYFPLISFPSILLSLFPSFPLSFFLSFLLSLLSPFPLISFPSFPLSLFTYTSHTISFNFTVANPSGEVPAHGSIYLDWFFCPLERKLYEFAISVKYSPVVMESDFDGFDNEFDLDGNDVLSSDFDNTHNKGIHCE